MNEPVAEIKASFITKHKILLIKVFFLMNYCLHTVKFRKLILYTDAARRTEIRADFDKLGVSERLKYIERLETETTVKFTLPAFCHEW